MKHLKERIVQKIHECLDIAHKRWPGETFKFPNVRFDKKGVVAGTANGSKWELNFNMTLCAENEETFIARTVPHEVAHLIDMQVYDMNSPRYDRFGNRKKRQPHGENWKRVMAVLGADSSRCHKYDVTNARQTRRKTNKFAYKCEGCGHVVTMGAVRHNKVQSGLATYNHKGCRNTPLKFIKRI